MGQLDRCVPHAEGQHLGVFIEDAYVRSALVDFRPPLRDQAWVCIPAGRWLWPVLFFNRCWHRCGAARPCRASRQAGLLT